MLNCENRWQNSNAVWWPSSQFHCQTVTHHWWVSLPDCHTPLVSFTARPSHTTGEFHWRAITQHWNSNCGEFLHKRKRELQLWNLADAFTECFSLRAVGSSPAVGQLIDQSCDATEGSEVEPWPCGCQPVWCAHRRIREYWKKCGCCLESEGWCTLSPIAGTGSRDKY